MLAVEALAGPLPVISEDESWEDDEQTLKLMFDGASLEGMLCGSDSGSDECTPVLRDEAHNSKSLSDVTLDGLVHVLVKIAMYFNQDEVDPVKPFYKVHGYEKQPGKVRKLEEEGFEGTEWVFRHPIECAWN